jgi:uncharacterized membrane protein YbhN (UPF0104 family)
MTLTRKTDTKNFKRQFKIFGSIIISVAALYFCMIALNGLNPSDIIMNAHINWLLAVLSTLIFSVATLVRSFVYPFAIDKSMTVMEAWQIVAIGNAANMVLPFRAGEGVRLAVFPKRYSAAKRAKLALIPGIADIGIILLLSIAAVYIADFKNPTYVMILKLAGYGFLAICALALIILLIIPKTRVDVLSYIKKSTLHMIKWVVLSWLVMLLSIWVGFLSFGYTPLRSVTLTLGAFAGMNIAGIIPSSPGNIGIFEVSVIAGLSGLGIAEVPAKTAGLILHLIQYAALIPMGLALYLRFILLSHKQENYNKRQKARHGRF